MKDKIIVVCGPTASGKTSLSIEIAERFNGEVISADSVSIYRGLNVGSAKPTIEERRGIPHHMLDVVDPNEEFSVSDYEKMALEAINDVLKRGKLPIICGGTGFYINSVLYKMSYGNARGNQEIRRKYDLLAQENGREFVYRKLAEVDPLTAEKLHPNDLTRVVRALEIFETTGVKKSEIIDETIPRFDFLVFSPTMPREVLYERINERVDKMIDDGLEDEVRGLLNSGVSPSAQSLRGIGYKEFVESILSNGEPPIEAIKQNTRRYAKRQIVFFKRYPELISAESNAKGFEKTFKIIDDFVNN